MTAAAETERKQADAAERELLDWYEGKDDSEGPPNPFGPVDELAGAVPGKRRPK